MRRLPITRMSSMTWGVVSEPACGAASCWAYAFGVAAGHTTKKRSDTARVGAKVWYVEPKIRRGSCCFWIRELLLPELTDEMGTPLLHKILSTLRKGRLYVTEGSLPNFRPSRRLTPPLTKIIQLYLRGEIRIVPRQLSSWARMAYSFAERSHSTAS